MSELNPMSSALLPVAVRPVEQDPSYRQPHRERPVSRETAPQGEYLPASEDYSEMSERSDQRRSVRDTPRSLALYAETGTAGDNDARGQYLNLFA